MSMKDLEVAFKLVEQHPNLSSFLGPRDEGLVTKAENVLRLKFPPTYRKFLSIFGCGGFGSDDFSGLIDDDFINSDASDMVWLTLNTRIYNMPEEYIIIHEVGDGTLDVIDTSQINEDRENPILVIHPSDKCWQSEKLAEDFGQFFRRIVEENLESDR